MPQPQRSLLVGRRLLQEHHDQRVHGTCLDFGIEDCRCCGVLGTEVKSKKSKSKTKRISCCDAYVGLVGKSNCDDKCNGKHASCSMASASMIEHLRMVLPRPILISEFSRRIRGHVVADEEHMFVGTAVEMKDNEYVDGRCMKDDVWQVDMRMTRTFMESRLL